MDFNNYSITSIDSIVGFALSNNPESTPGADDGWDAGQCLFILDELQDATLSGEAEVIWQTGREGRRLSALKRNKTCTIEANNGFIVGGLLAQQIGDFHVQRSTAANPIRMPAFERLPVVIDSGDATVTLPNAPITGTLTHIYVANRDGSQGARIAANGTDGFTLTGTTIELPDTIPGGGGAWTTDHRIIAFYDFETQGRRYVNRSDQYAQDVRLVCDIVVKDVCTGALQHSKLVMPRASISDTFSFAFGSDPAVQAFTAEAIASVCGGDREFFYWVFPEADAA